MPSVQCLWVMPLVAVPTGLTPDLLTLDVHLLEQSTNGICYDQHLLEQSADRNSLFTTWSSLGMEHAYLSLRFIRMEQGGLLKCVWTENTQLGKGRHAGEIIAHLLHCYGMCAIVVLSLSD